MSELSAAVCSITRTQRRRFFWAAWWTGAPQYAPFRKPDAAHGGARSHEEALREAEQRAGRSIVVIESSWAEAWKRILRGESPPPPRPEAKRVRRESSPAAASAWSLLGLAPGATLAELKRAYRAHALSTHPDRGGNAEQFRAIQRAYERLSERLTRNRHKQRPTRAGKQT